MAEHGSGIEHIVMAGMAISGEELRNCFGSSRGVDLVD